MSANVEGQKPRFRSIARQGAIGFVIATVINGILFFIGSAVGAFPPDVLTPVGRPVDILAIVGISVVSTIAAIVVYFILHRFLTTARANQTFIILAIVVLLAMFYNPFTIPNVPAMQIALLEIMHLVLGGALVYFLRKA